MTPPRDSVHCKQTLGDFPVSAPEVADQSLPGPEFISGVDTGLTRLQHRNFPASASDIVVKPEFSGDTGIFRRYRDFPAIQDFLYKQYHHARARSMFLWIHSRLFYHYTTASRVTKGVSLKDLNKIIFFTTVLCLYSVF